MIDGPRIIYFDQNAWIALAKGAWDKARYQDEHTTLLHVIELVHYRGYVVPLSFTNIYETAKINDPVRRATLARVQSVVSGGRVFRSRRRILSESLVEFLSERYSLRGSTKAEDWFLSNLWFEAVADYSLETNDHELPQAYICYAKSHPGEALFRYLTESDEEVRQEAVRRFTSGSSALISRIEKRRALLVADPLPLRRRVYSAQLFLDELDFILETARQVGLPWRQVSDLGSSTARALPIEVPLLHVERELAIRLEDQRRQITENDLRDMSAFTIALPLSTVIVAEKPFVNMALQAGLGTKYGTVLLTSIFELNQL